MLAIVLFVIVFTLSCLLFSGDNEAANEDYCYVTPPDNVSMLDWLDEVALYIELKSSALEGEVL